jgi:hypothetical protein
MPQNSRSTKRKNQEISDADMAVDSQVESRKQTKMQSSNGSNPASNEVSAEEVNRWPLASTSDLSCLIKMYDEDDNPFKLNDIAEFVGILSLTPQLANFQ